MKKEKTRYIWKAKRGDIGQARRVGAVHRALIKLKTLSDCHSNVLSYASFKDEFQTKEINRMLLKQGKLLLPKMTGNRLQIYHITSENQLVPNKWGIPEPDPKLCKKISSSEISCVLVPGLAFDKQNNRIGYGKGFYDRFLSNLPAKCYGLGFKEQFSTAKLPTEKHDISLDELLLF